ncbi:MAG TPA: tRNA uridine-5-carboxymethylaminomethyl(34) synthesis GTPase MnmE [Rhodanobacteraceae bacterium]|nr:tRNA uridine-5-carboxymethylaminomethyl(34) synthesis GTPase MnmE [Rhodanobacteraceae bacterium]
MTATVPAVDTIAAIATAAGPAGLGIVRVSGPAAAAIAHAMLGRVPTPRHAHFARLRDGAGALIDQGVMLFYPAPHSYTGEHVLELQGHGGTAVLDALLRRACELGARLARPGEFSERAFLNGKLDLAQAEAVADLIAARSQQSARAAVRSLQGAFSQRVEALLVALTQLRVHIEAAIDFPEEEIDFLADPAITHGLDALQRDLDGVLAAARRGVRLATGLSVAIVGRPNVGKSSVLNALAGEERAIVTALAGTTRDALREQLDIDGVVLELIDTAGLRDATDEIEREGVRRARAHLAQADLAVLVTEAATGHADLDLLRGLPAETPRLVVVNKIDLTGTAAHAQVREGNHWLWVSARTGAGLDALRERLKQHAGGAGAAEGAFSARRRHVIALERTRGHVAAAARELARSRAGELAAEELRQAQQALGEITGAYGADDLLGAIFGSFCIGK